MGGCFAELLKGRVAISVGQSGELGLAGYGFHTTDFVYSTFEGNS